jgi:hypothetical protein
MPAISAPVAFLEKTAISSAGAAFARRRARVVRRFLPCSLVLSLVSACGARAAEEDRAASARAASTACRDLVGAYATRVRKEGIYGFVYTAVDVETYCDAASALVADGSVRYQADGVDACREAIVTAPSCDLSRALNRDTDLPDVFHRDPACKSLFVGTRADGDACDATMQCGPSSDCLGDEALGSSHGAYPYCESDGDVCPRPGTCRARLGASASCDFAGAHNRCGDGLVCEGFQLATCEPGVLAATLCTGFIEPIRPIVGESCTLNGRTVRCEEGICDPRIEDAKGAYCVAQAREGEYCTMSRCTITPGGPGGGEKSYCTAASECAGGLVCNEQGVCALDRSFD